MNTAVFHHLRPAIVSRSQFRIFNGAPLMQRTNYALNIYRSIAMSVYIKYLPPSTTVGMVQDVASQFGRTKQVRIIRRNEGLIAEVTFLDMMSGISMVDELHQTSLLDARYPLDVYFRSRQSFLR